MDGVYARQSQLHCKWTGGVLMKTAFYDGDIESLRRWAINRANLATQVPEPYRSFVLNLMPPNCRGRIRHWVGFTNPDSSLNPDDPEWVRGFPHIHKESVNWPDEAYTVITYLHVPEEGGEFALGGLSPDDPYQLVKPEVGLTVMCNAVTWHGVRAVKRGGRMAFITTGFPE